MHVGAAINQAVCQRAKSARSLAPLCLCANKFARRAAAVWTRASRLYAPQICTRSLKSHVERGESVKESRRRARGFASGERQKAVYFCTK
jgi:hypothetical protein